MILVIDNYDSFTYNLVQCLGKFDRNILVYRNDKINANKIKNIAPSYIIISPGPCTPLEAGVSNEVIKKFGHKIPILGVCLGHQCIGHVFGAKIIKAPYPIHGKVSKIGHDGRTLFMNIRNNFIATRYHSWVIEKETLPECLEISASTDGLIMGIRHRSYPIEGVQFHPESFLTLAGEKMLNNFLRYYHKRKT